MIIVRNLTCLQRFGVLLLELQEALVESACNETLLLHFTPDYVFRFYLKLDSGCGGFSLSRWHRHISISLNLQLLLCSHWLCLLILTPLLSGCLLRTKLIDIGEESFVIILGRAWLILTHTVLIFEQIRRLMIRQRPYRFLERPISVQRWQCSIVWILA